MAGDVLIRQLEYLVALAQERHFGRAAAACHASQPALSAAVRKLEGQLGVTIVRRGNRFEGFTPEGQRVVGWAHQILAERDALRTDLDRMRHGLTATVRIGAIPTAVPVTPLLTQALRTQHPLARARIEVLSSRDIVRRLGEFDLDAGVTYLDSEGAEHLRGLPLYRERYLLLTGADGPYADQPVVGWDEAARLPLCALTRSMQNRRILDARMATAGVQMTPVVEADTVAALYAHVAGGGLSCVIAHTWLHALGLPAGLRAVPMAEPSPRPVIGVVTADHEPESFVAAALVEAVSELDLEQTLDRSHPVGQGQPAAS